MKLFEQFDPITRKVVKIVTGKQIIRYFAEHKDRTNLEMCTRIVHCFEAGQFPYAAIEHDDGTVWRIEQ